MSAEQAEDFLSLPYARDAITLRHWDDEAKVPSLPVPAIESYRPLIQALWRI